MLAVHRRNEILDLIQKNQFFSVRKLCSILFYSEATIRRDLEQLEKDGAIIRIRGGAMIREGLNIELPLNLRQVNNIRQKNAIAAKAAELIEDNDVLFFDTSSSVLSLLHHLDKFKNITVITNSLQTGSALTELKNCKVYSTGGASFSKARQSLVGVHARDYIRNFYAAKFFFSARSVSLKYGLTDSYEEEVEIKREMMNQSDMKILLADSSKINQKSFYHVCDLSDIDIMITDPGSTVTTPEWSQSIKKLVLCSPVISPEHPPQNDIK